MRQVTFKTYGLSEFIQIKQIWLNLIWTKTGDLFVKKELFSASLRLFSFLKKIFELKLLFDAKIDLFCISKKVLDKICMIEALLSHIYKFKDSNLTQNGIWRQKVV